MNFGRRRSGAGEENRAQITIVGLGLIGTSLGLAIKAAGESDFVIVGHDKEPDAAANARKVKAVDRTEWNLIRAVEKADLIILALPLPAVRETLQAMAQDLKAGCVIVDTAPVKAPVLQAAAELLPEHVHFVGGNPIVREGLGGYRAATADLFDKTVYCISVLPSTSPDAVQVAADLVGRIGARPLFLDAGEHDGLAGAIDTLPMLVAAALLSTTTGEALLWREMRRLAGVQFESATQLVSPDAAALAGMALANAPNLLRWLDLFGEELAGWRELVVAEDQAGLAARLEALMSVRDVWLMDRARGFPEGAEAADEQPGYLLRLLGLGGLAKPPGKGSDPRK